MGSVRQVAVAAWHQQLHQWLSLQQTVGAVSRFCWDVDPQRRQWALPDGVLEIVLNKELEAVIGDERLSIAASWSAGLLQVPDEWRDASFAESTAQAAALLACRWTSPSLCRLASSVSSSCWCWNSSCSSSLRPSGVASRLPSKFYLLYPLLFSPIRWVICSM